MTKSASHELAAMVNGRGRIGRHVETFGILRPDPARIWLDGERPGIVYDTGAPLLGDIQKPELLDSFVRLHDATPEQVLHFAQTFGTLSLRALGDGGLHREALKDWHALAARARATLDVAACLQRGEATSTEDWETLRPWWFEGWRTMVDDSQAERNQLQDVINAWLRRTDVRPWFSLTDNAAEILFTNVDQSNLGELSMLGAVAIQLALAVGRARFIATCSSCATTYLRERQATRGRANYCQRCGLQAAWRDAQSRRRASVLKPSGRRKRGKQ